MLLLDARARAASAEVVKNGRKDYLDAGKANLQNLCIRVNPRGQV